MEAIEKLVMLNVERAEVMKIISGSLHARNQDDGKENQIKGDANIPITDIVTAYFYSNRSTFSHQMNSLNQWKKLHAEYPQNIYLLLQIALLQSKHPTCDVSHAALVTFQKIRSLDPTFVEGMDYYAAILAKQLNLSELGKLSNDLLVVNDKKPEGWNATALYHEICGDAEKAIASVDKAILCNKQHSFSYQLKGSILLRQGQYDDAGQFFLRANAMQKDISSYEGMVESYLHAKRYKEAICTAKEAMAFAPRDSRALTLVGLALSKASIFSKDGGGKERSKKALNKALILDPLALRPLLALVDLYLADSEFEACLKLLRKAIEEGGDKSVIGISPSIANLYDRRVVLYSKLADVYTKSKRYKEALTCYHKALSLNPGCVQAQQGIEQMENAIRGFDSASPGENEGYEYIDYRDDR
jgi:tetratricopeptide (TPR) repeat protein